MSRLEFGSGAVAMRYEPRSSERWKSHIGSLTVDQRELDRLRAVPIFVDLTEQELLKLSETAEAIRMGERKVLTFQDEYAFKFFVILEGQASVWQQGRRIRDLGPGDFFGEIGLLDSGKRTATVVTETACELLVLMEWDLHMIEKESPAVAQRIRETLKERLEADSGPRSSGS